eukprot:TRINITY_DN16821_c0_g1_i1.p1 TRINITY_DN16821_c0_g1~~TRINITY_DN16821_c0_g1_i1.p1  ORF type:complete len:263 (-),score=36.92 TRINITY_DN16821_c0_g1_i1:44-832(-)
MCIRDRSTGDFLRTTMGGSSSCEPAGKEERSPELFCRRATPCYHQIHEGIRQIRFRNDAPEWTLLGLQNMLNEIDPTTPSMEAFCSQVVPQLVESGVATVLPEEPWAEVATLVWADRVPQALAQRRNNLNSLVPEELHDRLHGVTSEPGLLRFDIFPRAWQHHRSPAIIVLLGCECEESPLAAMRGSTDLWEMIFSYIPLRVQLNWDLNTTHDALQTRFTLLISSFTEYIEVTQVRRHPLVSSQAMGEGLSLIHISEPTRPY